ncbi:extradiol ring-cleavage dioxygenase class III protein subunit B [Pontibacter sp. BAB1700]|nr:extradiol ring-cleavage dioxygenase class III protein subunit B [Pontibacter sp. BAB1700]
MKRKQFIKALLTGVAGMTTLSAFNRFTDNLSKQEQLKPVKSLTFVGARLSGSEPKVRLPILTDVACHIPEYL